MPNEKRKKNNNRKSGDENNVNQTSFNKGDDSFSIDKSEQKKDNRGSINPTLNLKDILLKRISSPSRKKSEKKKESENLLFSYEKYDEKNNGKTELEEFSFGQNTQNYLQKEEEINSVKPIFSPEKRYTEKCIETDRPIREPSEEQRQTRQMNIPDQQQNGNFSFFKNQLFKLLNTSIQENSFGSFGRLDRPESTIRPGNSSQFYWGMSNSQQYTQPRPPLGRPLGDEEIEVLPKNISDQQKLQQSLQQIESLQKQIKEDNYLLRKIIEENNSSLMNTIKENNSLFRKTLIRQTINLFMILTGTFLLVSIWWTWWTRRILFNNSNKLPLRKQKG